MANNKKKVITPMVPETNKETKLPQGNEGAGLEDQEKNGGADQTPNPDATKENQLPQGNKGTGLEDQEKNGGVDQTPYLNSNKEDQKLSEVKQFKTKRPLLHNGKTYSIEDDVTGLFEGEELERLLKMGAIVEA